MKRSRGERAYPSGVFKPYAGVSTAILIFSKCGGTDHVWSYDMDADRKAKAFFVPVAEIRENKVDLSINRYKEIACEEVKHAPPHKILGPLEALEAEIAADLKELRGML